MLLGLGERLFLEYFFSIDFLKMIIVLWIYIEISSVVCLWKGFLIVCCLFLVYSKIKERDEEVRIYFYGVYYLIIW